MIFVQGQVCKFILNYVPVCEKHIWRQLLGSAVLHIGQKAFWLNIYKRANTHVHKTKHQFLICDPGRHLMYFLAEIWLPASHRQPSITGHFLQSIMSSKIYGLKFTNHDTGHLT